MLIKGFSLLKLFVSLAAVIVIAIIIIFFAIPPKVMSISPTDKSLNVPLDSYLVVKFDKPVERQKIDHVVYPEVYGEWKFEDSLIKNHLFKTLVFIPAIKFNPDTEYQVNLSNIINPLGFWANGDFSFSFKTQADNATKVNNTGNQNDITLIKIPFHWQEHPLSCEAASLKMALSAKGISVSEDDIMKIIGYDLSPRKDNVWGNPNVAFVGNIDGKICSTGFGVFKEPVAKAASYWRDAEHFSGWNLEKLVKEIQLGNPVIFWGVLPTGSLTDCSWQTKDGQYIKAFKETHVRLVIGFVGNPENPSKIIMKDPLQGDLYWPVQDFLTNWKVYDYSGVVIR